jgi:hypothetical protein
MSIRDHALFLNEVINCSLIVAKMTTSDGK